MLSLDIVDVSTVYQNNNDKQHDGEQFFTAAATHPAVIGEEQGEGW
jgi:hypothetical protein